MRLGMRTLFLSLFLFLAVGPVFARPCVAAQAADRSKELEALRSRANRGDISSQIDLGLSLLTPDITPGNCPEAFSWLQKAALQKSAHAFYILGSAYENGVCTHKDMKQAMALYQKGSDVGCGLCDVRMGQYYQDNGQPFHKILPFYEKAAAKGSLEGQYRLGQILFENSKDEPSQHKAFDLIYKTAQEGGADAAYMLAQMYGKGQGTAQDGAACHLWIGVAAALGNPKAIEAYKAISAIEMTPEQMAQSQALAAQIKQRLKNAARR